MLKEIHEQPRALRTSLKCRIDLRIGDVKAALAASGHTIR